jgi:alpha-tubulin suppressor-like RCC1 family protein
MSRFFRFAWYLLGGLLALGLLLGGRAGGPALAYNPAPVQSLVAANPPAPHLPSVVVASLSAGGQHTCAVQTDGSVACWGYNNLGQATPPAGTFSAVSGGFVHTCGLQTDGTLACWGSNSSGQSVPPAGTFSAVNAGDANTCGIKADGTVVCWGDNPAGQASPPAGTFSAISAGHGHTCGIQTDGTLACWGDNTAGQASPPGGTFSSVSAGYAHTCGIKADGTLACWGSNASGQATPPSGTYVGVSAGGGHTCAVRADGTLACWGSNSSGLTSPPSGTFSSVSADPRSLHTCGLRTDGTVACWGDDTAGQAPQLSLIPAQLPASVVGAAYSQQLTLTGTAGAAPPYTVTVTAGTLPPGLTLSPGGLLSGTPPTAGAYPVTIQSRDSHFIAIAQAYTLLVTNPPPTAPPGSTPTATATPPARLPAVTASYENTCEVKPDGTLACWGYSGFNLQTTPAGTFSTVSAGFNLACAVRTDGTAVCWGANAVGQATPPNPAGGVYTVISAGGNHACGVWDGVVLCWGDNTSGQATPPSGSFSTVSAGYAHSCGLKLNGTGLCWGANSAGQTTVPVNTLFSAISAGYEHTCGLRTDGTLACWGDNSLGQSNAPAGTFSAISAGWATTCGLRTDGAVACWGDISAPAPGGTFVAVSAGARYACGLRPDGTLACWGSDSWAQAPQLSLSPAMLPEGTSGFAYSQQLTTTGTAGAAPPYTTTLTAGSLPPGLTLSPAGLLNGTASTAGSYPFTIQSRDSHFIAVSRAYTLVIATCPFRFTDVMDPTAYYYQPVYYLACRGAIGGYSDSTFRPSNNTTRGQLSKIIVLAYALPITTPAAAGYTFADTPVGATFFPYVETAVAHNLVSGYACGSSNPQTGTAEACDGANRPYYRPGNNVTRGQLTKIVVGAAMQQQGWALLTPATASFSDVPAGSTFYPYIQTAVCHGVLGGYSDGTFRPTAAATRGQIVKIVTNAVTDTTTGCGP